MKPYKSKSSLCSSSSPEDPCSGITEMLRIFVRQECSKAIAERLPVVPTHPSAIALQAINIKTTQASKEVLESIRITYDYLMGIGKPLKLSKIFAHAKSAGVQIATDDPKSTYGARLRDHGSKFGLIHLERFGWWIRDRPYAPANYFPSSPAALNVPAGDRVLLPSRVKRK